MPPNGLIHLHRLPAAMAAVLMLTALLGCGARQANMQPALVPAELPPAYAETPAPPPREGSLWQASAPLGDLFINAKARRVGDIVTIRIVESSTASNQASTSTERDSSFGGGISKFFNLENKFPAAGTDINPFASVDADLKSAFEGTGSTTRKGDLNAYITARITAVLPNGNLAIMGTREVTINNEKQLIALSGQIRPRDISPDNVIQSTYISDARIAYSGSGIINDRQRPGWLAGVMETVWPF